MFLLETLHPGSPGFRHTKPRGDAERLTVAVLKDWLKSQGVANTGKKQELLERVRSCVWRVWFELSLRGWVGISHRVIKFFRFYMNDCGLTKMMWNCRKDDATTSATMIRCQMYKLLAFAVICIHITIFTTNQFIHCNLGYLGVSINQPGFHTSCSHCASFGLSLQSVWFWICLSTFAVSVPVCNTWVPPWVGLVFSSAGTVPPFPHWPFSWGGCCFWKTWKGVAGPILPETTWRKVWQMRKYLKVMLLEEWLTWMKKIIMMLTFSCIFCIFPFLFIIHSFISSLLVVSCFGPLAIGITPSSIDHGVENWAMAPEKVQLMDGRPSKGLTLWWLNFAFLKIALAHSHWKLCHKHDGFSEDQGVSFFSFFSGSIQIILADHVAKFVFF